MNFLVLILTVLRRNFLIEASYRFSFFLKIFSAFFDLIIFFFISRLIGSLPESASLAGLRYFDFVIIGLACSPFFAIGLSGFSYDLRQEGLMGTLAPLMTTPISFQALACCIYIGRFLMAALDLFVLLTIGVLLFKVPLHAAGLPLALLVLGLATLSFVGLGILSASFTLVYKRGDPVNQVLSAASDLLGGVYFPVHIMPAGLQILSRLMPTPYALHGLRATLLQGAGWNDVKGDLLALAFFTFAFLGLGLSALHWASSKVRKEGTLHHY